MLGTQHTARAALSHVTSTRNDHSTEQIDRTCASSVAKHPDAANRPDKALRGVPRHHNFKPSSPLRWPHRASIMREHTQV
jgi:hypothetical protein